MVKCVILMLVRRVMFMSFPNAAPQPPQGLLLTGEGLADMTPERLAMLGEVVGGLGLQVTVVHSLEGLPEPAEREPEPVPACFQDFLDFAGNHDYTEQHAHDAWSSLFFLSDEDWNPSTLDGYSRIKLIRD